MEGVRQLGTQMRQRGHQVEVVTLDDPKQEFVNSFPFPIHALGPSIGSYGYSANLVPWLKAHSADYDAVIVNGLWQYHSFGAWRALRAAGTPYYVFTHGMLDPWFKHNYPLKHVKKWLYWPWAEYRVLRNARAVLFTSEEERLLARQSFWLYRANERVVAYGTSVPPNDADRLRENFLLLHPGLRDRRVLLFLGRIHEKKGCDLLIKALARVANAEPMLHLAMAGPDQTGWATELKTLARRLGVEERISWLGMLRDEMKWGAFYCAEAFVLPSHQENFGIAVAEALACGVPVLISNKVNIWREIETDYAGLVDSNTETGTEQLLKRWLMTGQDARRQMSRNAVQSFGRRFTVDAMTDSLLAVIGQTRTRREMQKI